MKSRKTIKKYDTGGFGAPQLIQGLSGIMPLFADLSDDGKASGATIGQSIGSGLGFASNFIPGVGPIVSQAITPLLSAAGNAIGGLFDKEKKPRVKPYGYNINSTANVGNYSFAMGGMVPAQTEQGETVYNQQTNQVDETNATLPHRSMHPSQITDTLMPQDYVFPSHASAPEKKRTAKQWREVFQQLGAEEIINKLSLVNGKKYSSADLSEMIDRKYTSKIPNTGYISDNTEQLMEENKQQALQTLMMINEFDRQSSTPQYNSVPQFREGGSAFTKPNDTKLGVWNNQYDDVKQEYYYNNAFARYVSWRIANLPKNATIPRTSEYINDFNKLVLSYEKEAKAGSKITSIKDTNPIDIYDNIAKEYQDKLVKTFPGQGYENYPEVQAEPGTISIREDLDKKDYGQKTENFRYRTTMPYTHRKDVVQNSADTSAKEHDDMLRSRTRTIALNTTNINYSSAGEPLLRDIFRQTMNPNNTASEVNQVVQMQELGNNAYPVKEAELGRVQAPNITGYPAYRHFFTYEKDGTSYTVVLPAEDNKKSKEDAIKEFKKTGKHYGIYADNYEYSSEQLAQEGSMWQKVNDKMASSKSNQTVAEIKQQVIQQESTKSNPKGNPKTFKELQEQDPEVKRITTKLTDGKPVTQKEGDYIDNKAREFGLENDNDYRAVNSGMKHRTANAIAKNSKDTELYDYRAQSTPSADVKNSLDKIEKGERITEKERNEIYESSATSSGNMTAFSAQDRINMSNDIKYKQEKGIDLTMTEKEFIDLGYMKTAEDDKATGRHKNDESPAEIQEIINKAARKEVLTQEEIDKLNSSTSTNPNVKRTAIESNANIVIKGLENKVKNNQELTEEDIKAYKANKKLITPGPNTEATIDVIETKIESNKGKPVTSGDMYKAAQDAEVSKQYNPEPQRLKPPTYQDIKDKANSGEILTDEENRILDDLYKTGQITLKGYNDVKNKERETKNSTKDQSIEQTPANVVNPAKTTPAPINPKDTAQTVIVPPPVNSPQNVVPPPVSNQKNVVPSPQDNQQKPANNNPTYYDMLEQQRLMEEYSRKSTQQRTPTYYDSPITAKFHTPALWSGIPMNPSPTGINGNQTVPVMPQDYNYNQGKTETVIPQQETMPLLKYGEIPQPDLSKFGTPEVNNNPTFYDSAGYNKGWYNKGSNPQQFKYANDKVNDSEYSWNNQVEQSSSLEDKPQFNWGDPSMWAQFAGDTLALFANMRQKAPKLKGYSDAPYRALSQQMVPNYGMYENLTNSTLSQQQNALRGSVSNQSLLTAGQNQQVAQGLKAMNSTALGEQQRIDQIRQTQLNGIDQIARANVGIGNENMANRVALENAKKASLAQYGQSIAGNMANSRYNQMQSELYAGLYENSYPYASELDVSQMFPRFGRGKKK